MDRRTGALLLAVLWIAACGGATKPGPTGTGPSDTEAVTTLDGDQVEGDADTGSLPESDHEHDPSEPAHTHAPVVGERVLFADMPQIEAEPVRLIEDAQFTIAYYDLDFESYVRLQRAALLEGGVRLTRDVQSSSTWSFSGDLDSTVLEGSAVDCRAPLTRQDGSVGTRCGPQGPQADPALKIQVLVVKDADLVG